MSKGTINLRLRTFTQLEKTNSDFRSVPEVMSSDFFFWPLFCLFFFLPAFKKFCLLTKPKAQTWSDIMGSLVQLKTFFSFKVFLKM
jgi:hypothetical protein